MTLVRCSKPRPLVIALLISAGCAGVDDEGGAPPPAPAPPPPAAPEAGFELVEVTGEAGITWTRSFGDTHLSSILEDTGSGAAWLDYDGDGYLDLLLLSGTHIPGETAILSEKEEPLPGRSALWRNLGDGRFEDVTEASGLVIEGYAVGVAVADYDGDGDEDVFVCRYGSNGLFRNLGDGRFEDATAATGLGGPPQLGGFRKWSVNAVWFDGDLDGDLDLFVTNYLAFDPSFRSYYLPEGMPGPNSYLGQQPLYYLNRGDGSFEERAAAAGFHAGRAKGMGASVTDVDGDGDLDLFLANDTTANALFINDGAGRFEDRATVAGIAYNQGGETSASMHASWADVDGDGDLDAFVPDLTFGGLFINQGDGRFADRTIASGVAAASGQYSGWGADMPDLDNDGHADLFIANGKFHHSFPEQDLVLLGDGAGGFTDVTESAGAYFQRKRVGRGAAFGDYDNDGDIDVVVVGNEAGAAPILLRNDQKNDHRSLTIRVLTASGSPDAIGARVSVTANGRTQVKEVQRVRSYLSSSDVRVHFGLGSAARAERVKVSWPGGDTLELGEVEAGGIVTVQQGQGRLP